jgi:hypothetical protein
MKKTKGHKNTQMEYATNTTTLGPTRADYVTYFWVHVLVVLSSTVLASLFFDYKDLPPYFPIDISRIILSRPYAHNIFIIGIVSLSWSIIKLGNVSMGLIWYLFLIHPTLIDFGIVGNSIIGWVFILANSIINIIILPPSTNRHAERLVTYVCSFLVFTVGLFLKSLITHYVELRFTFYDMLNQRNSRIVWVKVQEIMINGSIHTSVIDIFKVSAVLQWISLYLLYIAFNIQ